MIIRSSSSLWEWGKTFSLFPRCLKNVNPAYGEPNYSHKKLQICPILKKLDLVRHFTERTKPVSFTRSRAYHKDDNAHIEQKNWTHVRQWLGYERFDDPYIVPLLNDLYCNEWRLFHNFFCPSVKLIAKERVGSKTIKRHDIPRTPYQRIMLSNHVQVSTKQSLTKTLETLNPFMLREAMEKKLKKIFTALHLG